MTIAQAGSALVIAPTVLILWATSYLFSLLQDTN